MYSKEMNFQFFCVVFALIALCSASPNEITCDEPPVIPLASVINLHSSGKYVLGAIVAYECAPGYVIKGRSTIARCILSADETHGLWTRAPMSCTEIRCDAPQVSEHGWMRLTGDLKVGSQVLYSCDNNTILTGATTSKCLSDGQWSLPPPECRGLCYLKDLKSTSGLSPETESVTRFGERLQVRCVEGYSPKKTVPVCLHGVWEKDRSSPCKENDCIVRKIQNGVISERTFGQMIWNWQKFRYERPEIFNNVPLGTVPSKSDELFLVCDTGYSFQGTPSTQERINCSHGRWHPDAVCLIRGAKYTVLNNDSLHDTERNNLNRPATASMAEMPTVRTSTSPTSVKNRKTDSETTTNIPFKGTARENDCSCEYTINDENLLAYADGKQLKMHDSVKKGSMVTFRCKNVDSHQTIGQKEITCENCRPWHSSDFPVCPPAARGVLGCHLNDRSSSSTLIINSVKDYYRFGESIELSCPPGQELTSNIEIVMCMGRQWSDSLPDCKNVEVQD